MNAIYRESSNNRKIDTLTFYLKNGYTSCRIKIGTLPCSDNRAIHKGHVYKTKTYLSFLFNCSLLNFSLEISPSSCRFSAFKASRQSCKALISSLNCFLSSLILCSSFSPRCVVFPAKASCIHCI